MKICILFFIIVLFSNISFSQNLFDSKEYTLEFTSKNINQDKIINIDKIKVISFKKLLKKILKNETYQKLNLSYFDTKFINNFILNMTINDEKIINESYYSKVKINFNKKIIINYLIQNKINYVENFPEKFLIIIYEDNGLKKLLLSPNNSYYKHLNNINDNIVYNNFLIPNLDFNDRYILSKNTDSEFKKKINKLGNKYNSNNIIYLQSKKIDDLFNVKVYLFDQNIDYLVYEKKIQFLKIDSLLDELYIKALDKWKELNEINTNIVTKIKCKVQINNIYELKFIRNILLSNILIQSVELKLIKYNENTYDIHYFDKIETLSSSLKKNRLNLFLNNDVCKIKLI